MKRTAPTSQRDLRCALVGDVLENRFPMPSRGQARPACFSDVSRGSAVV